MGFFLGLVSMYILLWLLSFAGIEPLQDHINRGIGAAAIMFILVGITHFAKPQIIEAYLPPTWKHRRLINYISGFFEILFGIGIIFEATRMYAGLGLLLLLIAVFPANIFMARDKPNFMRIFRLFFQPVYMLWIAWFCFH